MLNKEGNCKTTAKFRYKPFVQETLLLGLFLGSLFSEGLVTGRNFEFQNGLGLIMKQLVLTLHGFIFGRVYYRKDFYV